MARSRNPEPCGSYSGDYYLPLVWSTAVYQPQAQFCVNTLFPPPPPTSLSSSFSLSLSLSLLLFTSLLSLPLHWLLCAHVASKHTLHNVVASTTLSCGWNNCLLPLTCPKHFIILINISGAMQYLHPTYKVNRTTQYLLPNSILSYNSTQSEQSNIMFTVIIMYQLLSNDVLSILQELHNIYNYAQVNP